MLKGSVMENAIPSAENDAGCAVSPFTSKPSLDVVKDLEKIGRLQRTKRKQPIYLPGDPADRVYLLKAGRVRVSRITEEGREFTLALFEPGEIFGELEVLEGIARDTKAEAAEDVSLIVIERGKFAKQMRENPDLMLEVTRLIGLRLKRLECRIEDLLFQDVPTRLARILLTLCSGRGQGDEDCARPGFRITHQELANLIGSTRETVSTILNDFKRQGLVELGHRFVGIRDQRKIAAIH